jgi:hypothetical protein
MDKKILFMSGLLSTVVIGLLTFTHPTSIVLADTNSQTSIVPFTTLVQGEQSAIVMRVNYVVTSADELAALWKIIGATSTLPIVDFKEEAVIAVFAGETPQAAITVAKVEDTHERLVSILVKKPNGDCIVTETNRYPFEVIALAATSLPLTHEDIITTTTCAE